MELYGSIEVENSEGIPQDGPAVAAGPQRRGMDDTDEENNADTSSVTSTQVGESWASSQALGIDAEEAVVTAVAGRRMERKTSPVHRTDLTAEMPELRRQSTWIITGCMRRKHRLLVQQPARPSDVSARG